MINKEFNLHSFKSQAAKMSDFLNGKGHDISKTTLYHGLSVMFGEKNWNTLQSKLNNIQSSKSDKLDNKKDNKSNLFKSQTFYFYGRHYNVSDMFKTFYYFFYEANFKAKPEHFKIEKIHKFILPENFSDRLNDPIFLAQNIKYESIQNYHIHDFNQFVNYRIGDGKLIGDEGLLKTSFSLNFTTDKEENLSKILSIMLLILSFYPESEHDNNIFSDEPIIRTRVSGSKVKVTIFSFINSDYYSHSYPMFFKGDSSLEEMELLFNKDSGNFKTIIDVALLNDKERCDYLFNES